MVAEVGVLLLPVRRPVFSAHCVATLYLQMHRRATPPQQHSTATMRSHYSCRQRGVSVCAAGVIVTTTVIGLLVQWPQLHTCQRYKHMLRNRNDMHYTPTAALRRVVPPAVRTAARQAWLGVACCVLALSCAAPRVAGDSAAAAPPGPCTTHARDAPDSINTNHVYLQACAAPRVASDTAAGPPPGPCNTKPRVAGCNCTNYMLLRACSILCCTPGGR
jgi:hypothetical protein